MQIKMRYLKQISMYTILHLVLDKKHKDGQNGRQTDTWMYPPNYDFTSCILCKVCTQTDDSSEIKNDEH
jgi:hypothetical protein